MKRQVASLANEIQERNGNRHIRGSDQRIRGDVQQNQSPIPDSRIRAARSPTNPAAGIWKQKSESSAPPETAKFSNRTTCQEVVILSDAKDLSAIRASEVPVKRAGACSWSRRVIPSCRATRTRILCVIGTFWQKLRMRTSSG